jgi:hypothetical protein
LETKSTTPALFLQCSLTCFFSFDTPLLVCARNGHLKTCRLLLQCKADMGTEVELLLVGVPGNCYPGSRLIFDVRLCVHLCTLCVRRYQFSVRLHRSWLTPASGAGVERFSYQIPRAREFISCPTCKADIEAKTVIGVYTRCPVRSRFFARSSYFVIDNIREDSQPELSHKIF